MLNNRRRTRRRLQRLISERVERSFAHVCDSGGARRTWLRGLRKITKRYSLVVAAHNLGLIIRKLFGSGKPRQFASNGQQSWLRSALITITEPIFQILAALSHTTTSPKTAILQYNAAPHSVFINGLIANSTEITLTFQQSKRGTKTTEWR